MSFTLTQKVLFKHCDPAGIVFYLRYFEMINDCVEAFFDTTLGHPFEVLLRTGSVPTARIDATFSAPSRHGDMLKLRLLCEKIGRSSLNLKITARCGQQVRFKTASTLVYVDKRGTPTSWPPALRLALEDNLDGGA